MGAITEKAKSPFGGDDEEFTLTEPAPKKRNHAGEASAATRRRVAHLARIRQMRNELVLGRDMIQMSQAFIACSVLPYTRTKETKIVKTARLGSGETLTVTVTAGAKSEMAFGSDRILLYWLFDRAVKTDSRFVPMETIAAYLSDMGLCDSGKNYADLIDRLERLFGIIICCERSANGVTEQRMVPMFRASRISKNARVRGGSIPPEFKGKVGMLFDEEFFADLKKYRVPVPLEIIKLSRDRPQMLDTMLFLLWRVFAAQKPSLIAWEDVWEQNGHPDKNPWRLREVFKEAILMWKTIWKEFNCESCVEGLWIRPPLKGVQLLLEGDVARKLENGQLVFSTGKV